MYRQQMISNPTPTLREKLTHWSSPFFLIVAALYYWALTLIDLPFQPFPKSIQDLRHRAFSRLWLAKGKALSEEMPGPTVDLIASARGRVLDIGPGSGEQMHRFNVKSGQITELWGVEPATDMHEGLNETARALGLGDKFHALACGAEPQSLIPALAKEGMLGKGEVGIFDDICLIRVLCGVPEPAETAHGLYRLLKPGGRFIVCEHVLAPWPQEGFGSPVGRLAQIFWHHIAGWKYLLGGCQLNRDSERMLRDAAAEDGGWAEFKLEWHNPWAAVPYKVGVLTKKSDL